MCLDPEEHLIWVNRKAADLGDDDAAKLLRENCE